jgi:hypothetical protein
VVDSLDVHRRRRTGFETGERSRQYLEGGTGKFGDCDAGDGNVAGVGYHVAIGHRSIDGAHEPGVVGGRAAGAVVVTTIDPTGHRQHGISHREVRRVRHAYGWGADHQEAVSIDGRAGEQRVHAVDGGPKVHGGNRRRALREEVEGQTFGCRVGYPAGQRRRRRGVHDAVHQSSLERRWTVGRDDRLTACLQRIAVPRHFHRWLRARCAEPQRPEVHLDIKQRAFAGEGNRTQVHRGGRCPERPVGPARDDRSVRVEALAATTVAGSDGSVGPNEVPSVLYDRVQPSGTRNEPVW